MIRYFMVGTMLLGAALTAPGLASAQTATQKASETAASEDPNDKAEHERSFEETRKHMQLHSDWSKQSGKMNDN